MKSISTATEGLGHGPWSPFFLWSFELFLRNLSVKLIIYFRAVTKISSCQVNTTSRRGIKQPGISFGSIFLLFSYESRWGPCSQQLGEIPGRHLLMTTLIFIGGKQIANGAIINKKKKSQTAATFSSQTYRVKILPGPFSSIDLILKLLCHDSLGVLVIQMC